MRIATLNNRSIALLIGTLCFAPLLTPGQAVAQTILVVVNDDPITSFDVDQRVRWTAITHNFGEQMKARLTNPAINDRFKQLMMAAQPHSQQEAQAAAERIKKQLIEEAKHQVLAQGGGTSRKAVIDTLIEDKLKLQAANKMGLKVSDREVEETIEQRTGAEGDDKKAKVEQFYQQFESNGIARRTVQEVFRAQLAWRNVIGRQYGPRIASMLASISDPNAQSAQGDVVFDVRVLRLAVEGCG